MNEEQFNMTMRKFLKKVGVTSQREIEHAISAAMESGKLQGNETLKASVVLEIPEIGLRQEIEGGISLE
ncbi:MAG: DUF6494 family protein [Gammaproteobacteria bacterium]